MPTCVDVFSAKGTLVCLAPGAWRAGEWLTRGSTLFLSGCAMKALGLLLGMMALGCSAPRAQHAPESIRDGAVPTITFASMHLGVQAVVPGMTLAYILKGDCPNWSKALAIATKKMGCNSEAVLPEKCRMALPCDVCQFLKEGVGPQVLIVDFPAEKIVGKTNHAYAATDWDARWKEICPLNDTTDVEIRSALCYGKGLWGFDRVDTLAKAMVHEALHLCRSTGGKGPATIDKEFWEYLFCPGPDAEDVVELCWGAQN